MDASAYERISAPFRRSAALLRALQLADRALPAVFYAAYPLLLALLALGVGAPAEGSAPFHPLLAPCVALPAAGFALVSALRKRINAPRPYEALGIEPLVRKETRGQSCPSKHAFASLMIALCWVRFCPTVGAAFAVLALCVAVERVIAGVHFPPDVAAGMLIALALGAALFLW